MIRPTVSRNVGKAVLATGLVVGLTPVLGASPAYACSCVGDADEAQLRGWADVVFKGRVLAKTGTVDSPGNTGAETITYTFKPTRTYKGKVRIPQKVSTPGSSASCGVRLTVGSTYLVYATKAEPEGKGAAARKAADRKPLQVGLCSGTQKVRR